MARPRSQSAGRGISHPQDSNRHRSSANDGPTLLDLIERQEFNEVIARIKARPSEAKMTLSGISGAHNSVMNQGNLALHEACKNQPTMELIEVLLAANEDAIRAKGQWGYLPLHFACASRASPEVIAKLIVVYPEGTRADDDHEGTLPLHLAAKWGSADEVIMTLLMIHPNASTVEDSSGKTPLDHARMLSSPQVRETAVAALLRAPILCAVSQTAMNLMSHESESKLREVVEVYQERMIQVKDRYEQEKAKAVALEVQLRKELWDAKEKASKGSDSSSHLSTLLEEKDAELKEKNQILQQISGLISSSNQNQNRINNIDQGYSRDQRADQRALGIRQRLEFIEQQHDTRDDRGNRENMQEHAVTGAREWVPAGKSVGNKTTQSYNNYQLEKVAVSPSPRAAAVATVKEWFSSETTQLSNDSEEDENFNRLEGADDPARDKVETYRQGHRQRGKSKQNQREKKQTTARGDSLLSRSRSVPRTSSVKLREFNSRIQSPAQEYSGSGRKKALSVSSNNNSSSERQGPDSSHAYSYSTSSSRQTQNTANTTEWRARANAKSQNALRRHISRDRNNQSPTRPREGGGGYGATTIRHQKKKAASTKPVSTHVYLKNREYTDGDDDDDCSDSLTMDSQMVDWE